MNQENPEERSLVKEVKEQIVHDKNQERYEVETPYQNKPLTMGALGQWLPIMFTLVGLVIAATTSIAGIAISNASRMSIVETILDSQQNVNVEQSSEIRRTKDLYDTQCKPYYQDYSRQK